MFAGLSSIFAAVGSGITSAFKAIGGAVSSAMSWAGDFVGNIGSAIKTGFEWVTKPIEKLFGAKTGAEGAEALLSGPVRTSATPSPQGLTEGMLSGEIGVAAPEVADVADSTFKAAAVPSGGLMSGSLPQVSETAAALPQVSATAGAGGKLGGTLGAMPSAEGLADTASKGGWFEDLFGDGVGFMSTDMGQTLGQGALGVLASKLQSKQQKEAFSAQRREAQRQEEQAKRDWVEQQNRQATLDQNQRQYQQESYLNERRNRFAGVTGKMYLNNTAVPQV